MVTLGWKRAMASACLVGGLTACGGGGSANVAEPTTPSASLPASYRLVWSDEFTDAALDTQYWAYDLGAPLLGGTVWGNSEQQYYTSDAQNVSITNGQLVIQAVAGLPSGAPTSLNLVATSARVKTDTSAFYAALNQSPYGFYEIRADIPCVAGAWPAIWAMGKDGNWPDRGELDIMEWFGRYFAAQPNQVQSGVHTGANYGENSLYAKLAVDGVCEGFHRFQLHWQQNSVTFGVDDQTIFTYNKPSNATAATWPFDQPAHLLLNVAVGGNLGGAVNLSDIPNMVMKVDYVKVWQP